jgi:protein TonB
MFRAASVASASAVAIYAAIAFMLASLQPALREVVVAYPDIVTSDPLPPLRIERPPFHGGAERPAPADPTAEPRVEGANVPVDEVPAPAAPAPPVAGGEEGSKASPGVQGVPGLVAPPTESAPVAEYYEEAPVVLRRVRPDYPSLAKDAGISGTVLLHVLVGQEGRVEEVRVLDSIPVVDQAAVEAARQWTFRPARVSGRPVRVWVALPIRFSLH